MPPPTTAIVGQDQEPQNLNVYLSAGANRATRNVTNAVLAGMYRIRPDFSYEPVLVDQAKVEKKPFAVTYSIKPEAQWSDGVPVSADDVIFTLQALLDPSNDIVSRTGYELITDWAKVDAKTVRLVFSEPYAPWKTLFPQVFPQHMLEGEDFDSAFLDSIPVASGPFRFQSWQRGTQIILTRNDDWWGLQDARLERLVFRYIPSAPSLFQALQSGELTVIEPQPALQLLDVRGTSGIAVDWTPGQFVEHVDINVSGTMPLLEKSWFREALAYALDRQSATREAYELLVPGIEPLNSLVLLRQQAGYRADFDRYEYDAGRVARIMGQHDCVMGNDGVWVCEGTRASLRFTTTSGDTLRALMFDVLQAQAASAGIELRPAFGPAGVIFGQVLPAGDWDLFMFTWLRSGDPFGLGTQYGCGGVQNYMHYCSPGVTELFEAADTEANEHQRIALLNRADAVLADDVPSLPLHQRPQFVVYWAKLRGIANNPSDQGLTWNVEEWQLD